MNTIQIAKHPSRHPELVSGSFRYRSQMLKPAFAQLRQGRQVQHDDSRPAATFTDRVYQVVRTIPAGSVLTYAEVATLAGSPRAARAVGQAMKRNQHSFVTAPAETAIPCHRVVSADNRLGDFNAGQKSKIALLATEGWRISDSGRLERNHAT